MDHNFIPIGIAILSLIVSLFVGWQELKEKENMNRLMSSFKMTTTIYGISFVPLILLFLLSKNEFYFYDLLNFLLTIFLIMLLFFFFIINEFYFYD